MTASSEYNTGYQAAYGRLNGDRGDGWCAKEASRNGNEWTTAFKLSYSSDTQTWTPYKDVNDVEVVRYKKSIIWNRL